MTDSELIRRADAAGIAHHYQDWRGEEVAVTEEALTAILAAVGDPRTASHATAGLADDESAVAPAPAARSWGFAVQLYSVRSRASWGHGDLRDLAELAAWSARRLGAGFVLVNPLHAAEPLPPVSPSPYLPMTRRFASPLYLRVEDIPEYGDWPRPTERIDEAAPRRCGPATPPAS